MSVAFPLLKLPAEIRNRIWEYAVLVSDPINIEKRGCQHTLSQLGPSLLRSGKQIHIQEDLNIQAKTLVSGLALASTCRQIYMEATPVYYSKNWFAITWNEYYEQRLAPRQVENFIKAIGPANARCIRAICLTVPKFRVFDSNGLVLFLTRDSLRDTRWMRGVRELAVHYQRSVFIAGSRFLFLHDGLIAAELSQDGRVSLERDIAPLQHMDDGL